MSDNQPKDPDLWESILDLARGKSNKPVKANGQTVNPVNDGKGFTTWPSAYGVGWALAQYKRLNGKWETKKKSSTLPSVQSLVSELEREYDGLSLVMYEPIAGDDYTLPIVRLKAIHFPKEKRGQGYGSSVMLEIKRWADKNNIMIALTPSKDLGGSSVARLKRFYGQFGYKSNKGRDKDFRVMETMVYDPSKNKRASDLDMPRKWDRKHCMSKTCEEMGFSEKASCRPYKNCYKESSEDARRGLIRRIASLYMRGTISRVSKRDKKDLKNTGHGGLDTWFAGHGGGKPDERATWGDWIAVTPVKHTITKEDGSKKEYVPGDIVGPCAVSSQKEWSDVTSGGKKPLKCMPRSKAYQMSKDERASLARKKRREENKHRGQKPVNTPTFSDEAKEIRERAKKKADFYRQVSAPDSLSSYSNGTPVHRHQDEKSESSSLPTGDTARNIGRPSPDSPNLKYRNLDRSESYGRTPANREDFGYVHDSGSGSARVIPYDSGYANNSSALRKGGLIRPPQHLVEEVTEIASGALAEYLLDMEGRNSSPYNSDDLDILEAFADDLAYLPKGIKRGEETLSDVAFQLNSGKSYLSSLRDKVTDTEDLTKINEAHSIISGLKPREIFEGVSLHKESIRRLSNLFRSLFDGAEGSDTTLINPYAKEKYEEALQKNSHRRKHSRNVYSWRVSDPSLSHPLYVNVEFKSPVKAGGSYGFGTVAHIINFYFDSGKTTWGAFELNKIEDVARHELVHLMQKEIAIQRHLSTSTNVSPREYRDTGLPRSRYDETFRQPDIHDSEDIEVKRDLLKSMRDQYRAEGLDPNLISIHALDDIEFYSRLLDEVSSFRKRNPQPNNKDIRAHLDRSQFFQSLKRYKPKNWKKAVGIFVSEVVK